MFRKLLAVSLVCAASTALAQGIYSWKDASGQTHYSDNPPADATIRALRKTPLSTRSDPPPSVRKAPHSYAENELAFRKRQAEAGEAEEKAAKNKLLAEQKQKECRNARAHLGGLESGQRVVRFTEDGERVFMEDDERAAEISRTQAYLESYCK